MNEENINLIKKPRNGADRFGEIRHNSNMKLLWNVSETSNFLGIGMTTLYKLIDRRELIPVDMPGISRTLFRPADVAEYVDSLGERTNRQNGY